MTENQLMVYRNLLLKNMESALESYENTKDERFYYEMKGFSSALKHLDFVLNGDLFK